MSRAGPGGSRRGPVSRFRILGVYRPPAVFLEEAGSFLTEVFPGSTYVSLYTEDPPHECHDYSRRQLRADCVVEWLGLYRGDPGEVVVGVVEGDAYVTGLNFVFGLADPVRRVASVYLYRLYRGPATPGLVIERLKKEVLHEVGHVLGLGHCRDRRCVMSFSNSLAEVDLKRPAFCRRCVEALGKRGVAVSNRAVLEPL